MMMVYLSIIGLILLVTCPVYYCRMTRAYADEVRRLEHQVAQLTVTKEELDFEVAGLVAQEDELNKQKLSLIEVDPSLPTLGSAGGRKYKNPEAYLLSVGTITAEDIQKAQKFKQGSKSPYNLGEILVMMDTISPAELSFAKSKVRD
ncbi:hypothetical protein [Desulfovibrio ferrophilus]|uniref:Uncharacterized protein n=1 Tax=Desulfovibrio ferrophilus TaxID=241368 RepID=A0A2Z6B022_9BACT|nr:hypothetical protein [Desulfovibrio ferrophilus]BBD08852.1 hypothetical protein DFE_2126 [Desulfovibrio ferrophilus]